ncbi:MAG: histone deacetylase family protein [Haliea sp.]|nr:MAG: histone deacetylase family protein [Haliea sp.]
MTANKTGYFTHPDCRKHEMGRGHPECPERLDAIEDRLLATGVGDALDRREAPRAVLDDIALAHDPRLVGALEEMNQQLAEHIALGGRGYAQIDPDTALNSHTWDAVLRASGAVIAATDAVIGGELENAFCAVRPPGHHACRSRSMGFCVFNQVAVGVLHALERHGLQRVAVVDFDVHHGNGTEDILSGDDRVLMVGIFQHPFYPGTGDDPLGTNMLNLPVPAYTKGDVIRRMISERWIPALEAFQPEMVFISAGFDAHREDDLGQLGLVEADYTWITAQIKEIANKYAKGRIVSSLEGGYNLSALGRSVEAHLRVLADL